MGRCGRRTTPIFTQEMQGLPHVIQALQVGRLGILQHQELRALWSTNQEQQPFVRLGSFHQAEEFLHGLDRLLANPGDQHSFAEARLEGSAPGLTPVITTPC